MTTTYVGGQRHRLINDSMLVLIRYSLGELGWYDSGRRHLPLSVVAEPVDWDQEVGLNTVGMVSAGMTDRDVELGSNASENRHIFWVDFFAENDVIGRHVSGDIADILRGKINAIGRARPTLTVYDYTLATPVAIFSCEIEHVRVDRAHSTTKPWQKNWWSVQCEVVDHYGSDLDAAGYVVWTDFGSGDTWLEFTGSWEDL